MSDYRESCRACTSFKSFMKAQASFASTNKSKESSDGGDEGQIKGKSTDGNKGGKHSGPVIECPVDKDELGRASWTFLHTMAAYYPDKPDNMEKSEMIKFINLFSKFYPCSHCAEDMRRDISQDPPNVDTRYTFSLWMCNLHNKVNRKLGKPAFDCSKVDERWLNGPADGTCG